MAASEQCVLRREVPSLHMFNRSSHSELEGAGVSAHPKDARLAQNDGIASVICRGRVAVSSFAPKNQTI